MPDDFFRFNDFARELHQLLGIAPAKAARLAELLEDRVNELAEKKANDALDREFNRGDWRY